MVFSQSINSNMTNSEQPPILRMEGVCKRFGPTVALDNVHLEVRAGEVLALVGENGAGKSTLMKILSGAYQQDEGKMWLEGKPYHPRNPLDARRKGVAMIYQELSLAPDLSVEENIVLGMEPHVGFLLKLKEIRRIASEAMQRVGHPDIPLDTKVRSLSVAEQQLVEIARAIAIGSKVLVLDEPTSSLTQKDIQLLFNLVRLLKSQQHAIIYISHFLEEVQEISDRYTVLRDGKSVGGGKTSDAKVKDIISMMVGRTVEELYPHSPRKFGETLLRVDSLSGVKNPKSASFELRRGEVLGIAGLVGAGRTELIRSIFGLDRVRNGEVKIAGFTSMHRTPHQNWMHGMGVISEDRKNEGLATNLSIVDNLTLSRLTPFISPRKLSRESERWVKELLIKCDSVQQPISDLSGGTQQKVAIARLLYHDVDIFLMDEPTRGIDVGSKAQIYQLIDKFAIEGKAVLIVSSYLPELMGICDRIAVMCRGVLGPAHPVSEVNEQQIMLEATGTEIGAA
jgi:ribose transport system ATP-binding protein